MRSSATGGATGLLGGLVLGATSGFLDAYVRLFLPRERHLVDTRIRQALQACVDSADPVDGLGSVGERLHGTTEPVFALRLTRSDRVLIVAQPERLVLLHISRPGSRHAIEQVLDMVVPIPVLGEADGVRPAPEWFLPGGRNPLVAGGEVRLGASAGQGPWLRFLDEDQIGVRRQVLSILAQAQPPRPETLWVHGAAGTGKTAVLLSLLEWLPVHGFTPIWCGEAGPLETLRIEGVEDCPRAVALVDSPFRLSELDAHRRELKQINGVGMIVGLNLERYPQYLVNRARESTDPQGFELTTAYRRKGTSVPPGLMR